MPTYDFECKACGHAFEQFQSMTAKPLRVCPECGKRAVDRLIGTGAGLLFKGSGFYITDYRSESYKQAAKTDSNQGTKTDSNPGTKTESGGTSTAKGTEPKPKKSKGSGDSK
ncbi:MAG: zinc ribbon domain-containing protein [bacterium]|nr:zinc ribbon domain-containing protein [bacterium]